MTSTTITGPGNSLAFSSDCVGELQFPAGAWHHFRDGVEQLNMGEPQQALAAFQNALQHAPNFPDAHVGIGVAYALCSDIYPAIDHLQEAIGLEPENFHAHFKLSQLYFKLRIPQKGYEQAKFALRCAQGPTERQLLAQLLREERTHEHNGISRPWLNRPLGGSAMIAGVMAVIFAIAMLIHYMH